MVFKITCENNSFKIFRIELENSNLIVTTEKQAREMEALWEKLLNAGAEAVSQFPWFLVNVIGMERDAVLS